LNYKITAFLPLIDLWVIVSFIKGEGATLDDKKRALE